MLFNPQRHVAHGPLEVPSTAVDVDPCHTSRTRQKLSARAAADRVVEQVERHMPPFAGINYRVVLQ